MSGDRQTTVPSSSPTRDVIALAEQRFIPQRYEPNYAYPLLVMFHGRGGDEHQLIRSVPTMSWRNYVALGLRGPEALYRGRHELGYGWGPLFSKSFRRGMRPASDEAPAKTVHRILTDGSPDSVDLIEEGIVNAVRDLRRSLHVHTERIFLVGLGEGAAVAYRLGLAHPERFAGVVALNGWLPRSFPVLSRLRACREHLRVLAVHGEWNGRVPIDRARRDVQLLRSAGLHVAFQTYPCANRLTGPMLSDVDTWLIQQCTNGL